MDNFIYETPTKVYFGRDEELKVGKLVAAFHPNKVLLHYGGQSAEKSGLLERIRNCLREENVSFTELGGVVPNPELSLVREGIALCIKEHVDFVPARQERSRSRYNRSCHAFAQQKDYLRTRFPRQRKFIQRVLLIFSCIFTGYYI